MFSSKQQAEIVSRGIEAMNDVLLYNAFLYQKPSKGFWGLCYLFYFFAKKTQTLDFDVDSNGGCFINNFKHLLAFQLANVSQFDTEEIATIFALLKGHANHLNLHTVSKEKKGTTVLCINLKEDEPPRYVQLALDSEVPYLMYISSNEVSSYLFNTLTTAKNASYSYKILLLRLVKTVSVKQSRKTERVLANDEVFAEIGFSQLINFLLKKNQETLNVALNQAVPDFEIESITGSGLRGHEFRNEFEARLSLVENPDDAAVVEYIPNDEIWPASENKEELVRNAEFVDKSGSGFCLRIRGQKTVAQIGDIIRVEITDSSVVTVVRRIVKVEQAALVVGVEILGSAPEIIHVKDNTSEEWISGCLLKNSNGTESVIIKANEFKNKENLLIDNNQKQVKYHMEKILHTSTSVVKHVQITPQ